MDQSIEEHRGFANKMNRQDLLENGIVAVDAEDLRGDAEQRDDLRKRNWGMCLVFPVYGMVFCLTIWNMHLQCQMTSLYFGGRNVSSFLHLHPFQSKGRWALVVSFIFFTFDATFPQEHKVS